MNVGPEKERRAVANNQSLSLKTVLTLELKLIVDGIETNSSIGFPCSGRADISQTS